MDTWAFVDEWVETYFKEKSLRSSNAIRQLLALAFAYFEESELLELLAERFQTEEQALLIESKVDTVLDWLMLYTAQYFPQLNLFLFGKKRNREFNLFRNLDLELAVRYLPQFVLCNLRDCLEPHACRSVLVELAKGTNILKIEDFKTPFTKRMAHHFYHAPREYNYEKSIWYALVVGSQGDPRLVSYFHEYYKGRIENLDFLQMVIRFFSRPGHFVAYWTFVSLIGYIQHLCDETPNFSMKGWTLASLQRRRAAYYDIRRVMGPAQMPASQKSLWTIPKSWEETDYPPFLKKIEDNIYQIVELTTYKELCEEGAVLKHCVHTYAIKCRDKRCSIWSLQRTVGEGKPRKIVTIEVNNHYDIIQARGKHNSQPKREHMQLIEQWAELAELGMKVS